MASVAHHAVVILYEHALLGEGIAKYLHAQTGVQATLGSAHDPDAVRSALAKGPKVVIFESNDPIQQFDLTALVPNAVLIDVSTVITRGSALAPSGAGFEQILQVVREHTRTDDSTVESGVDDSADGSTVGTSVLGRLSDTFQVGTSASPAR